MTYQIEVFSHELSENVTQHRPEEEFVPDSRAVELTSRGEVVSTRQVVSFYLRAGDQRSQRFCVGG